MHGVILIPVSTLTAAAEVAPNWSAQVPLAVGEVIDQPHDNTL